MPRFIKNDLAIETSIPVEAARLRAQGFIEQKAKTAAVREADAERAADGDEEATKPASASSAKTTNK
ncbi:hypothetical protein SAMN04487917_101339 [Arthrobacter sp. yr096]|uniref:hypothetical protein n=1 Tax=Arthrobacter sp. yr096 TaxID=1761750 RepID=UPI0008D8CD9F|nr:hypothetical protein [Arthrobacter sp. yr096]SEI44703.1 hypothetical protein SAMN04487917_101339 [Arthrobacter sp. yr096]